MDGKTLSSRAHGYMPSLPVLFVSGYPAEVLSGDEMIAEGDEVLTKPFTPAELVERVEFVRGVFGPCSLSSSGRCVDKAGAEALHRSPDEEMGSAPRLRKQRRRRPLPRRAVPPVRREPPQLSNSAYAARGFPVSGALALGANAPFASH
jgi:hypothetical protein